MSHIVQPDAQCVLVLPAGRTARTSNEVADLDAAAARISRLRALIASLPPAPPVPEEAIRRDSMYD